MEPKGKITPLTLTWETGQTFEIDDVLEVKNAASLKAGGIGMRYKIRIGKTITYLWLEEGINRWFVERRS